MSITTPAHILTAVSASHGTSDSQIIARIKAVSKALDAGISVKTLASDLKTASLESGSTIVPVVQSVLGYATGVLAIIDKLGVSLATASEDKAALAATYRAVHRHGKKTMIDRLVPAAIEEKSPESKMTALKDEATAAVADAVEARRRDGGKPRESEAKTATITEYDKILHTIAAAIGSRAYSPTPEFLAALHGLVNVVTETAPRKTATPAARVPATV